MIIATKKGQFRAVEELLQLGADPNIKEKVIIIIVIIRHKNSIVPKMNSKNKAIALLNFDVIFLHIYFLQSCGLCPLLIAVKGNDFPIVNLFLNNNRVKINISNDVGETALILAVKNGNTEIVNALLQKQELANDYVEAQDVSLRYCGLNLWGKIKWEVVLLGDSI